MIETSKENLKINKLIAEKKEIISVDGDMIVPDSKPDILNTICTSGVVSVYKKEIKDEKVRLDGNIDTYIMYMPDGVNDSVRGLNTSLDFSENINVPNCQEGMNATTEIKVKSIDCKVLNGRKIGIKATLEIYLKIYSNEDVEVINEVQNANNIQILKEDLKVNSLIGQGNTKISAKDNIPIDAMDNLAEILKCNINMVDKDIKTSYNKVLTKSEVEVKIIYLTEDNRINTITSRIPVVGFIDIPNVMDENTCDVNYEIKNVIIKPNSQEEHSICVEVEIEVTCSVYEEKNLNLIQDMYSPCENIEFNKKEVLAMTDKQESKCTKQINEKINLKNIQNQTLIDVDIEPTILKESKINTKILYEGELNLNFIFVNSEMKISIKDAKIPFEYTVENLQNGESLQTNNQIEIKQKDFIIQDSGDVQCNIDMEADTNMYRTANVNIIDSVQENGEREEQDYSIVMYIVKKGDTLWNIAKMFGSTVDSIARVNGIENPDEINIGQKLFIPKFSRVPVTNYE